MSDYAKLKELAEGCRDEVIRSHGWAGMIEDADLLRRDEQFLKECSPDAVLALIADLERNQRMLLAACMDMGAIGSALGADMNSDGEELLSLVVDLKADLEKERAVSKGWHENWKGVIAERDLLKAERDNLREDRDGLLDAGAHLL